MCLIPPTKNARQGEGRPRHNASAPHPSDVFPLPATSTPERGFGWLVCGGNYAHHTRRTSNIAGATCATSRGICRPDDPTTRVTRTESLVSGSDKIFLITEYAMRCYLPFGRFAPYFERP